MLLFLSHALFFFFFQAEDGIRDVAVTGVQTCALPICPPLEAGGPLPRQVFRRESRGAGGAGGAGAPRGGGAAGDWGLGVRGWGVLGRRSGAPRFVSRGFPSPEPRAPSPASASGLRYLHPLPDRFPRRDRRPALRARTRAVRAGDASAHGGRGARAAAALTADAPVHGARARGD